MYQQNQTFRVTVIIKTVLVVLQTPAQLLGSSGGGAKLQTYEYRIGSVEAEHALQKKGCLEDDPGSCWVRVNFQGWASGWEGSFSATIVGRHSFKLPLSMRLCWSRQGYKMINASLKT